MSSQESTGKTVLVAFLLCFVCSIIVAGSVVALKPIQEVNKALNLKANILTAAGMLTSGATKQEIEERFAQIKPMIVDLDTGEYVDPSAVGAAEAIEYDQRKASKDPKLSKALSGDEDLADIKRRVKYAKIYLVEEDSKVKTVILPVSGYGLWSTLHGFLALEGDFNTVAGLGFYEHAETPGLGGEVDNPRWKAIWPGKEVYDLDDLQSPRLTVVKGAVDNSGANAKYEVDGLSGATLTSNGVANLIQFWMGDMGFKSYIQKQREGV